ncbi:hypothetical protein MFRU_013g01030 [Monilinia fructicola]|nr:hypothetical protein MFRU_013g01030 [Monilinia fructicola]
MVFDWFQRAIASFSDPLPSPTLPRTFQETTKKPDKGFRRRSLKYGVELEYVLAFHELELDLTDYAGGGPDHGIEKIVPLAIRREESWSPAVTGHLDKSSSLIYNSWGILQNNARNDDNKQQMANVRPYHLEPQSIVLNKLNEKASLIRDKVIHRGEQTRSNKVDGAYDKWIVSTDRTVVGQGSRNLYKWLPRLSSSYVSRHWDSYGIEVISRVLSSNNRQDRIELEQVVNALKGKGNELYEGFITNQCALHVHIQAPSLEILKELAAILLIYEEEISRLHPKCRRPGHRVARSNLTSNRMMTFLGPNFVPISGNLKDIWDQPTETSLFRKLITIQQIRDEIGQLQDEQKLADYMCFPGAQKTRVVNFRRLKSSAHPQTIEFRQARGSLDINDINHWVDFCLGLVQLAEYYVHHPGARIKSWDEDTKEGREKLDVFQLMGEMKLDRKSIDYWRSKIARYMACEDEDERSDIEVFPSERKYKTPPKAPKAPDGSGRRPPPLPPGASKAKEPLMPPPAKAPPKASIFPPVPSLYAPIATKRPAKSSNSSRKPKLSRRQLKLLTVLEQFQTSIGSDRAFFDVDTSEGSTIPPISPALSPNSLIFDPFIIVNQSKTMPKAKTSDRPANKSPELVYKKPKANVSQFTLDDKPEDFYRKYDSVPDTPKAAGTTRTAGSVPDTPKAAGTTRTAGRPTVHFVESESKPSGEPDQETRENWDDYEYDSDEELRSGIFSGDIDVASFHRDDALPLVEYSDLRQDEDLLISEAPGGTGWDNEHEEVDEDSDTEVASYFFQGGPPSGGSKPVPPVAPKKTTAGTHLFSGAPEMSDYGLHSGTFDSTAWNKRKRPEQDVSDSGEEHVKRHKTTTAPMKRNLK